MNPIVEKIVNFINPTWRPTLAAAIVTSVVLIYVIYPIAYVVLSGFGIHIELPPEVISRLNDILITGGVLAGLRTAEKYLGVTDKH